MIIAFKNSRNKWIAIDTINNIGIIYKSKTLTLVANLKPDLSVIIPLVGYNIFTSIWLFFEWTIAADFLIMAMDLIKIGLTKNSPISKYFFDLCVDAPQYLSTGTLIPPMLSYSFLVFII